MSNKKIAELLWIYLQLTKGQQFLLDLMMKYKINYEDFIKLVNMGRRGELK